MKIESVPNSEDEDADEYLYNNMLITRKYWNRKFKF
jgi:hypothetical protein